LKTKLGRNSFCELDLKILKISSKAAPAIHPSMDGQNLGAYLMFRLYIGRLVGAARGNLREMCSNGPVKGMIIAISFPGDRAE
jgi:hypothetical protein